MRTDMLRELERIVRLAGDMVREAHDIEQVTTEKTGAADLVTKYDVAVQGFLKRELLTLLPEADFFGEEGEHAALTRPWTFIVDPIDGTTNLIHDYRMSAVSLGLYENGQMTFGVVYNPFTEETFHATLGKGAFLNGEPIHVSHREALDTCIIAFGSAPYEKERASMLFPIFQRVFMETADFRRSASAALDLCYLAAGRIDGFFELNLKPWDYAAGSLIIEEAGGKITDWNGTRLPFLANSDILTCTPEIYERIKELLKH